MVGIFFYILENIPSKPLANHKLPHGIEVTFVELNLKKVVFDVLIINIYIKRNVSTAITYQ